MAAKYIEARTVSIILHRLSSAQRIDNDEETAIHNWEGTFLKASSSTLLITKILPHLLAIKPDKLDFESINAPFDYNWFETLCVEPIPHYATDSDDICIVEPANNELGADQIVRGSYKQNLSEFIAGQSHYISSTHLSHLNNVYTLHSKDTEEDILKNVDQLTEFNGKLIRLFDGAVKKNDARGQIHFKNWFANLASELILEELSKLFWLRYILPPYQFDGHVWNLFNITGENSETIYPHKQYTFLSRSFYQLSNEYRTSFNSFGQNDNVILDHNVRILVPCWGDRFIKIFCDYLIPSLLEKGNSSSLRHEKTLLMIFTDNKGLLFANKNFMSLAKHVDVKVFEAVPWGEGSYNQIISCYRLGLSDLQRETTTFFLMPDQIYSSGSIKYCLEKIREGKKAVIVPNMRVKMNGVQNYLASTKIGSKFAPRNLVRLARDSEHIMTEAQTINPSFHLDFFNVARVFWRVESEEGTIGWSAAIFSGNVMCAVIPPTVAPLGQTYDGDLLPGIIQSKESIEFVTNSDDVMSIECSPEIYSENFTIKIGTKNSLIKNTSKNLFNGWFSGFHLWQFNQTIHFKINDEKKYAHHWEESDKQIQHFRSKLFKSSNLRKISSKYGPNFESVLGFRLNFLLELSSRPSFLKEIKSYARSRLRIFAQAVRYLKG